MKGRGVKSIAVVAFASAVTIAAFAAPTAYQRPAGMASLSDPEVVTGYKAIFTCSAHFFAGRPLDDIKKIELEEMSGLGYPDPVIDEKRRLVSASDPSGKVMRIAAFRDSMGCTVLPPEWGPGDISRLPNQPYVPAPDLANVPFPAGDLVELGAGGVDPDYASLAPLLDKAFDPSGYGSKPGTVTTAVIVLKGGRIVAERYRPGFGIYSGYRTWSTSKSMTALLMGIASKQGLVHLDGRAEIPEWSSPDDPRRAITYKQLMWMSSGLFSGGDDAYAVYFGGQDVVSAITGTALEAAPGTRWKYANNDTLLLARALRHKIGDESKFLRYPYEELLRPLGMHHTRMEVDHAGMFVSSSQTYTTARDLARLGLFLYNDGVWNGKRLLPEGFLKFASTPAPTRPQVPGQWGYGAQFWLYDQMPGVPPGTYSTTGRKGQFVTVVPGHDLVIVRTGVDPQSTRFQQDRFVADIVSALR